MSWKDGPWQAVASLLEGVKDIFPAYEEQTIVSVYGNPASRNADLFNQAIAIAFGQTRSALGRWLPVPFAADAQYDLMHKSVTVTLTYTYSGIFSQNQVALAPLIDRFFNDPPPDNLKTSNPSQKWLSLAIEVAGTLTNQANGKALQDAMSDRTVVWALPADIAARPIANMNGNLGLVDHSSRGATFTEMLVLNALGVECRINDAWSSIRGKSDISLPGQPGVGGVTGSSSSTQITGLVSDLYASLLSESNNTTDNALLMTQPLLDIYTRLQSTEG